MTFEELRKCNRDNDGYIILDSVYDELAKKNEFRGKMSKEWLILDDSNALIKFSANQHSYQNYAELLAEATYILLGIKSAYYDLVSLYGNKGVISRDIRTNGQVMIPFRMIFENYEKIFNENTLSEHIVINRSYNTLIDFRQALIYNGYNTTDIESIMKELDRVFIARNFLTDFDLHWENLSLLLCPEGQVSLAPQYDSSAICRFMSADTVISRFYQQYNRSRENGQAKLVSQDLSIRIPQNIIEANLRYSREGKITFGFESIKNAVLKDRDRFLPILSQITTLDYQSAIKTVQERIQNPLPDLCKEWFSCVCSTQIKMIEKMIRDIGLLEMGRED